MKNIPETVGETECARGAGVEDEVRKAEGARHTDTGPLTQSRKGSPRGVGVEEGHDMICPTF